jgi:hypothetical protein
MLLFILYINKPSSTKTLVIRLSMALMKFIMIIINSLNLEQHLEHKPTFSFAILVDQFSHKLGATRVKSQPPSIQAEVAHAYLLSIRNPYSYRIHSPSLSAQCQRCEPPPKQQA